MGRTVPSFRMLLEEIAIELSVFRVASWGIKNVNEWKEKGCKYLIIVIDFIIIKNFHYY